MRNSPNWHAVFGGLTWRAVVVGSVAAWSLCVAHAACAAAEGENANSAGALEEVVVTARKREEGIYSTPIAISALTTQSMQARNIESLSDLGDFVPNLNITRYGAGNLSQAALFIRGIGTQDHLITVDPGVGVYIDGIYLGREIGSNLDLTNIERVEVLRGPQGTLYGRNTLGGAVNIVTRKPGDESITQVDATVGSLGRVNGGFYSNFKMTDDLSVSMSGDFKRRNGVGKFLNDPTARVDVGQEQQISGRIAAKWRVSDSLSFTLAVDGDDQRNGLTPMTDEVINPAGLSGLTRSMLAANPDDSNTVQFGQEVTTSTTYGAALTTDWQFDEHLALKVLAGYRSSDYKGGLDDTPVVNTFSSFPERGDASQYSLESQLNGEYGKLDFVGGLYGFREKGSVLDAPNIFFFTPGGIFSIDQTTKSYAGYAHVGYGITDKLKSTVGVRYSRDTKDADAYINCCLSPRAFRSHSWGAVTADASLDYELRQHLNAYASVARGYQSGGFPARPFGGAATYMPYNPTYATNYETGMKGVLADVLQLSASVFYTQYTDLALQYDQPSQVGFITLTANAGKSEAKGAEFEGTLKLSPVFSINSSVGYLDSQVTEVRPGTVGVAKGDTPALTPKWTLAVSPQYAVDLPSGAAIRFNVNYSYRSAMFGQSINNDFNRMKVRGLANFNLSYSSTADWTLALYGENIFNKIYDVARSDQFALGYTEIIRSNDRREFGLKISKRFGG